MLVLNLVMFNVLYEFCYMFYCGVIEFDEDLFLLSFMELDEEYCFLVDDWNVFFFLLVGIEYEYGFLFDWIIFLDLIFICCIVCIMILMLE